MWLPSGHDGAVNELEPIPLVRPAQVRLVYLVNHTGFFLSHRLPLALAARAAGYDVHVATPRSKHVPDLLDTGLKWEEVRMSRSGLNPIAEARSLANIHALYRRLRPALVHQVTSKPVIYGTIAARVAQVPAVVNAVSGMGHAFAAGGIERRALRRVVSWAYGQALRHPRMRVIVQNDEHARLFATQHWVRPQDITCLRGAGVDMTLFRPRPKASRTRVRIVLVSRMLYTKGVADFVEASRLLRERGLDVDCVLVGEPDQDNPASISLSVLRTWHAQRLVQYMGRQNDMPSVYGAADIACLPTFYGEGVPKALVEAAACGLPTVTTDWPGCRDVVVDGETGLLVPVKDPVAVADALDRLVRDAELRQRMGRKARERVQRDFSLEFITDKTLEIYDSLLQKIEPAARRS